MNIIDSELLKMVSKKSLVELEKENQKLKTQLKEAEKVIELGDYWDELKVNDYLKARKEYKAKYKER